MCTKILKKESSSRALAFFMLMCMMPLGFIANTQSCGAMEAVVDASEQTPLREGFVTINGGKDIEQGGEDIISVVVQFEGLPAKIDIPKELKEKLDHNAAAMALGNIQDGLYYLRIVKAGKTELIEKFITTRVEEGKYSDRTTFESCVVTNAVRGAALEGPLQEYFRDNNLKIEKLIQKIKKLEKREAYLRNIILNERQQYQLGKELAESKQKDHEINLAELKSVNRTNFILKLSLPAAIIVTGVGTWALMMYWGGYWNK